MLDAALAAEIAALGALALGITQAIKKWTGLVDKWAILVSAVISILLGLWKLFTVPPYDWTKFVIIVLGTFVESNGIYHFGAKAIAGKTLEGGILAKFLKPKANAARK